MGDPRESSDLMGDPRERSDFFCLVYTALCNNTTTTDINNDASNNTDK